MSILGLGRFLAVVSALVIGACSLSSVVQAQTSPSAYTTGYRYNALGQLTGRISPDPDGAGPLLFGAVRDTYDAYGNLANEESGQLATWQAETVAPASWTGFTVYKSTQMTYDVLHRKLTEQVTGSDGQVRSLTQFSYDVEGRLQCTAVRMNPAVYNSLPASACMLGVQGTGTSNYGPDRITENVYDATGQLIQVRDALGTTNEEAYATYGYGLNGEQTDVVDANGNHAQFAYDGFDRKAQWNFSSPTGPTNFGGNVPGSTPATALATAGSVNANDYEAYGYDPNGNRTSLRKRDATVLTYQYDHLDRVAVKIVPQRTGLPVTDARSVYYSYDARGHQLTASFDSSTSGQGLTNTFDGFGRQTSSTLTMDGYSYPLSYQYDNDGDRVQVTHPDGNYVTYVYDGLDRPLTVLRSGTATVASYAYNPDGTRQSFNSNGTAVATSYTYDPIDRLATLSNNPASNAAYNNQYGFTYSPADQLTQLTKSNNAFVFAGIYNVNRAYATNGLNQYTAAGAASFIYDANANLIGDGANTFLYDIENRLVGAGGVHNAAIRYDPLGRIYEDAGPGATTRFVYDGDALVAEYDQNGNLLRRYVHGADEESDDPIAWYEGSGFSGTNERFMRPDWQGSIGLITDTSGTTIFAANTYDEYGIPGSANAGRFQYTGQAWLPELGMYYYKARMYSPTLGRFMQTDPIGYKDNVNLYAYVGNDPMDKTDFTGQVAGVDDAAEAGAVYLVLSGVVAAGYCVEVCGSIVHNIEKAADQIFHPNTSPPPPPSNEGNVSEARRRGSGQGPYHCTNPQCGAAHGGSTGTTECPDCDGKRKRGNPVPGPTPRPLEFVAPQPQPAPTHQPSPPRSPSAPPATPPPPPPPPPKVCVLGFCL